VPPQVEDASDYINQQVEDAQQSVEDARAQAQQSLEQYQKVCVPPPGYTITDNLW